MKRVEKRSFLFGGQTQSGDHPARILDELSKAVSELEKKYPNLVTNLERGRSSEADIDNVIDELVYLTKLPSGDVGEVEEIQLIPNVAKVLVEQLLAAQLEVNNPFSFSTKKFGQVHILRKAPNEFFFDVEGSQNEMAQKTHFTIEENRVSLMIFQPFKNGTSSPFRTVHVSLA